jgi:hypothetical protein
MDGIGIGREGSVLVMYEVSRGFSATAFTEQVLYRVSMEEVALAQFYVTSLIVDSTVREAFETGGDQKRYGGGESFFFSSCQSVADRWEERSRKAA